MVNNIKMSFKLFIIAFWLCLDKIEATKVEFLSKWKPGVGWAMECSWVLFPNDTLQSVTLYSNNQQLISYRPANHGKSIIHRFELPQDILVVDCAQTVDRGQLGRCILFLEVYQPPKQDLNYSCEVSGEGPQFRIDRKDLIVPVFVPPSDAIIHVTPSVTSEDTSGSVALNCTSTGLPAPSLEWAVGSQKVPQYFSGSNWNVTSKLWHVWSLLLYTPTSERLDVTCSPEISQSGNLVKGKSAMYNKATRFRHAVGPMTVISLFLVLLR